MSQPQQQKPVEAKAVTPPPQKSFSKAVKHARFVGTVQFGGLALSSLTVGAEHKPEMEVGPAGVWARITTRDGVHRMLLIPFANVAFCEMLDEAGA